ncbi:glutathione peroxidase gpx1 [Saguinus oedipus]|uniref:Glutathione peroxidase 1 n=1 Tax=Saguinus oedipus TaxID=9490 RepID=A0ABQ9TXY3_SAGOE|nr:glutathione peroxidase gpx1 [Saguinus oedipus]
MCAAWLSVYAFSARPLTGREPMNELQRRLGPRGLVVLGFPCNQFGHQENAKNEEILNSLKYVRPGGGFEPNFMLFEKREVNGAGSHPLFAFLREALPAPSDDATALMTDPKLITWSPFLVGPDGVPVRRYSRSFQTIGKFLVGPDGVLVRRYSRRFQTIEKFLVGPDGVPVRRYSRRFQTIDIEPDIQALLSQGPSCA